MSRFSPSKWWWFALFALLAFACLLRLTGYNFSLPYIDHPDEPVFYLTGREWRGLFDASNYLAGYPPIYIWLSIVAQWVLEAFGIHGVASTIQILRLVSIGFDLLTLLLIVLTARRAGGWLAGMLAGLAWAVAPLVIENGIYAIPDPLVYLLVIASIWLAVVALLEPKRAFWSIWSVGVGCLAILTKYYVVSAVLPGMMVAAWIFWRDRRRGSRYLAVQALLILVSVAISAAGLAVLGREGATARSSGLANLLNLSRILNNLYFTIVPLNPAFWVIALLLGSIAFWFARRQQRIRIRVEVVLVVLICAVIVISVPWLAAAFSEVTATYRIRDVLPATTAACVLLGLALAQIAQVLPRLTRGLVAIVPAVLIFAPQLNTDYSLVMQRTYPDSRVALRQWADLNLTPGTVLVGSDNHKTFNPFWGGIEGQHWFDWIISDDISSQSVETWRKDHGISYAVLDEAKWLQLQQSSVGQQYLSQMLLLRNFTSTDAPNRGPDMVVFRLWGMQHLTGIHFRGGIDLAGYDLDRDTLAPGDNLTLTFYWHASETPPENDSLFVHLLPQNKEDLIAQVDSAPARPERPTSTWTDGSETLISQPFTLTIPAATPPGIYDLQIGLYNYLTGVRLQIDTSTTGLGDAYLLTHIQVQ
ncbi:MAG: glycosyltransferase family 39 protein [Chloroflexota bacterium]